MTKDPNKNRLLANRYQLVELIGKGAMGQVYQAHDMLLGGVTVAVKLLSQELLNHKRRDRFMREATICALLGEKSIHIVRVKDYGLYETEMPFYVMEYLQGENLKDIIKTRPLPLSRFLSLSRQICLGLQCAHKGVVIEGTLCPIIHRDIKPSNIFVIPDTTLGELLKILDFGIAKVKSDNAQNNSFMGTPAYCSPEQMAGKELDNRSDIYSLGVMMFEMLTGSRPLKATINSLEGWSKAHQHQPPKSFDSVNSALKLPKVLENIVMSCLAKVPGDRPQKVSEILEVLESLDPSFGQSRQPDLPITNTRSQLPVIYEPTQTPAPSSNEDIYRQTSWPQDKPLAEIVFPYLLSTNRQIIPTLWIMLSKQEIENRRTTTRYNQFLFLMSPHPMILWITALYNNQHGPRWLPCYLDLKTRLGQEIARTLGETGSYRLLFFPLEEPQHCANVMISMIAPAQCQLLQQWVINSQTLISVADSTMSKIVLKQELDKLKPKILMKLSAMQRGADISG